MFKEHVKINVYTKLGAHDFVFTSRLTALRFIMDESRREEVLSFSVDYIDQYEITDTDGAKRDLQLLIVEGRLR